MAMSRTFVVVGAGQAGAWVARTLRSEGFDGRIVLIGDEPHWPYERPPLSKTVLAGAAAPEGAVVLSAEAAAADDVEAWLGERVVMIDRAARTVRCASGRRVGYDRLFLTTGAAARRAAWLDRLGARGHVLRTADDAQRLRAALRAAERLIIVGGGWIGLEVAATARGLGLAVTVIEIAERLCARSAPAEVSRFLLELHRAHGVDMRLANAVTGLELEGERVVVGLADGHAVRGDLLLAALGASPCTALADACGLAVEDGVLVDAAGRTSDPDIFAAGDVARPRRGPAGRGERRECWQNAQNQAIVAAQAALGQPVIYDEAAWLWSDQYDQNLQVLGSVAQASRVVERQGANGGRCWAALDPQGRLIGAVAANAPRELRWLRRALQQGATPDLGVWSDASQPLEQVSLSPAGPA